MAVNRGKQFEAVVRVQCEQVPNTYVLRLYDPQGGYSSVANPCDFVVYRNNTMYMLECKAMHGNLISIHSNDPKRRYGNISNTQVEQMLKASECGIVAGILVWWADRDTTKFIPIQEVVRLYDSGVKSIRYDRDVPNIYNIGGVKKRVFFEYDFESFFKKVESGC